MGKEWLSVRAGIVAAVCVAGCSSSSGGTPSGSAYITWTDSENGADVLDANGVVYRFDATTGCMFALTDDVGPTGFCLTANASAEAGFEPYGATQCVDPASNSDCNAASFNVVLTANPSGAGCIAVLGNGGATAITSSPLAVTAQGDTSYIQTTATPSAYKAYWNGIIPVCGGSSPFAGAYTSTTTSATPNGWVANSLACGVACGATCAGASQNAGPPFLSFTVDSGGIVDNDALKLTGTVLSSGDATFSLPSVTGTPLGGCTPTFTAAGTKKAGATTFTGTEAFAGQTYPFSAASP